MYNIDTITNEFFDKKFVTFRRSISSDSTMELGLLDKSASGIYFDDGHPLIRLGLLDSFKLFDPTITTYNAPDTYQFGEIVDDSGQLYESLIANNTDPLNVTTSWRATDQLSLYHRSIIKRSFDKVIGELLSRDEIVDNVVFQKYSPSDRFQIDNDGSRVGLMFIPKVARNYTFSFNRVGSHFEDTQAITLELYKGNTLLTTFPLSGGKEFVWDDSINFDLDDSIYFLTYEQAGLTNRAINDYGWESLTYTDTFQNQYVNVQPFKADPSLDLTDIDEGQFRYGTNYGISIDFTVKQDMTNWINRNLRYLSKVIQLQYTYDVLEEYIYNANYRLNIEQRNSQNIRLAEVEVINLEGDTVARRLKREYDRLKKTMDQLTVNDRSFGKKEACLWTQEVYYGNY